METFGVEGMLHLMKPGFGDVHALERRSGWLRLFAGIQYLLARLQREQVAAWENQDVLVIFWCVLALRQRTARQEKQRCQKNEVSHGTRRSLPNGLQLSRRWGGVKPRML